MLNEQERIKKILVKNIRKFRASRELTQEEAAELVGITAKYWQRLEMTSQIDLPSITVLFKIAKTLKIPPAKLLEI